MTEVLDPNRSLFGDESIYEFPFKADLVDELINAALLLRRPPEKPYMFHRKSSLLGF
jgi:hypothetical protein